MQYSHLTDENLTIYAAQNYKNRRFIDAEEFNEDVKRVNRIRGLLTRRRNQILNGSGGTSSKKLDRIILNNIIIVFNVFEVQFAKDFLLFRTEKEFHSTLKTVFIFLSYTKENDYTDIPLDPLMIKFLRDI